MFLNDWQDRSDTDNDTQDHVEANEKFMESAISSVDASVVAKAETNPNKAEDVEEDSC